MARAFDPRQSDRWSLTSDPRGPRLGTAALVANLLNRAKRVQGNTTSKIRCLSARRAGLAEWIERWTSNQKREISHGFEPAESLLFTTGSALPPFFCGLI